MNNITITLSPMTRALCHELFTFWKNDPCIFEKAEDFYLYRYSPEAADRYFDTKNTPDRRIFAVMLGNTPIGELQLKRIDFEKHECTMSIHMQNDAYKGRGYGTQAVCLGTEYAFSALGMYTVLADCLITNTRSRHVIEKVGFEFTGSRDGYAYYRMDKSN